MENKNIKDDKGITLIALIITIVVLLILAIIAIGEAKESNIVDYAENAVSKYDESKGIENNTIAKYESILSQYSSTIGGNDSGSAENGGNNPNDTEGENSSGGSNTPGDNASGGNNTPIDYLGRYVKYDADGDGSTEDETILWRVLRNDADKVELITADALGTVDLSATDFNSARNKYNDAIPQMVAECVRITGIDSVRNVGGPAIDTTETVVFANIEGYDVGELDYSQYEGGNGLKVENDYEEDFNQMQIAGVDKADNSQQYWLSSRVITANNSGGVWFSVWTVSSGGATNVNMLCKVLSPNFTDYSTLNLSAAVRPILTLTPGILTGKTGGETSTLPIEILQNN